LLTFFFLFDEIKNDFVFFHDGLLKEGSKIILHFEE
jgi:hypothetical protein